MPRVLRVGLVLLFAAALVAGPAGCKDEAKPNSELKVPEIPAGDRGSKGGAPQKPN